MELCSILCLCASLLCIASGRSVDLTLEQDARGADTVRSVLSKMEQSNIFDSPSASVQRDQVTEQFIRELAYIESRDGEDNNIEDMQGGGGIWRMENNVFQETKSYEYSTLYNRICELFCIDWQAVNYEDLRMPLYSGLAVRIYLYHLDNTGRGLPEAALDRTKASFWLEHFRNNQQQLFGKWLRCVSELREIEVCRVDTDVVFVLDSSGSIRPHNYQIIRDYTYNFTESLLNGDSNSRVGIILYGTRANVEVDLDFVMNNGTQALLDKIVKLRYLEEATNTPEGLCLLKSQPWRDTISTLRLAVVLTDGHSNRLSTSCGNGSGTVNSTSREVHSRKPQIVVSAVGVGNYNINELMLIATSNDTIDELTSFDPNILAQNQYYRSYSTCFKVVQDVSIGQELEGSANRGSFSRLRFSGTPEDGVAIRICVEEGSIIVYGSYTNPNPGRALYDFREELRGMTSAQCLTAHADQNTIARSEVCSLCEISSNRGKRQAPIVNLYITIEGSMSGSRFTVNSSSGSDLVDELKDGCMGDSNLCDSDATVVCQEDLTGSLLCECVYVSSLEDVPSCKRSYAFLALTIVISAVCVAGLSVMIVSVIVYVIRRFQAHRGKMSRKMKPISSS